jgi:hypothetical protein
LKLIMFLHYQSVPMSVFFLLLQMFYTAELSPLLV